MEQRLVHHFKKMKAAISDPSSWLSSKQGLRCGIDGYLALANTTIAEFRTILKIKPFDFEYIKSRKEFSREARLSLGLALVASQGGTPKVTADFTVLSDWTAFALSSTYRKIRLIAARENASVGYTRKESKFNPHRRETRIGGDFVRSGKHPSIPFYTMNHELAHIGLFADAYSVGNVSAKETRALAIEALCISADFFIAAELGAFSRRLHMLKLFIEIENSRKQGLKHSVLLECARKPSRAIFGAEAMRAAFAGENLSPRRAQFVDAFIGLATVEFHRTYAREQFVPALVNGKARFNAHHLRNATTHLLPEILENYDAQGGLRHG